MGKSATSPSINFTLKGEDTRNKRGYSLIACKKEMTQKAIQSEKSEKHESGEGTRKNARRAAK